MNRNLSSTQQKDRFARRIQFLNLDLDSTGRSTIGQNEKALIAQLDAQDEAHEVEDLVAHHARATKLA